MLSNRSVGAVVRLASASTKVVVPSSSASSLSASSPLLVSSYSNTATFSNSDDYGASQKHHYYMSRTNKRTFSSNINANVKPAAADRRIAGRRRFYKHVGIATASPPTKDQASSSSSSSTNNNDSTKVVQSPISAGVDGTQSATGVNTTISNTSTWSALLNPFDNNNDNNNNNKQESWYTVTLDNRTLRTPLGLPLTLPSLPLALAVASEWDSQKRYLQPAQMPLMTLCCTTIDQVASDPTSHQNDVIKYLMNDTTCYWADPTDDRVLHRHQLKAWDGLHDTLSSNLLDLPHDLRPAFAVGGWGDAILLSRKSKGNSKSGLPHPPLLVSKAELWIKSLDAWALTALFSACAESKSFYIGAALIHDAVQSSSTTTTTGGGTTFNNYYNKDGNDEKEKTHDDNSDNIAIRDGKWAVSSSRVEEEFNIECWGLVEGNHDYDRLNCSIQMHAASFLVRTVATAAATPT